MKAEGRKEGYAIGKKERRREIVRILAILAMLAYLMLLAYLLFFSSAYGRTVEMGYRYNLVPFLEIRRGLENIDKVGYYYVIVNIAGNVVAFMPFGFLLPLVSEQKVTTWKAFCGSVLLSFAAESIQLVSKTGAFDVDDLILNTAGGILGYWCYVLFCKRRKGK